MKRVSAILCLLLVSSCGVLDTTGHCDFRPKESRCQEREGLPTTLAALEAVCKAAGAPYATGPCPRQGSLGGCDMSAVANPVRDWYYADPSKGLNTADDVKKECDGSTFLAP